MPIRRYPASTAPLTTLITISTDSTRPVTPNAIRNGAIGAMPGSCSARTVSQDSALPTACGGSAAATAATSARTAAAVPALRNRYSICMAAGCAAAGCRAAAVAGVTQPSAEPVTDAATPTTVSVPGRPVTVSWVPSGTAGRFSSELDSTTWPGPRAQCPDWMTRSSTGPPGVARPARVSDGRVGPGCPASRTVTVTSANGPAAAVTPGSRLVAASRAAVAWVVTTASAPCCAVNAWSNGALESTARARPSTEAALDTSSTRPVTSTGTRRRNPL